MSTQPALDDIVERLERAAADLLPCAPVRYLIDPADIDMAYRVQTAVVERREKAGHQRVGRKIGLTSPAVQQQFGVDRPDFGVLLDDMAVPSGGVVAAGRLLQPKVEGEIAFRLGADLIPDGDGGLSYDTVRAAVQAAHAAIEIVDSRIAGWDISIVDTIADNASSGLFVIGERGVPLTEVEPAHVQMTLLRNGEVASSGAGSACLDDPLMAVLWLASTAARYGDPLRAGELVLSGALGPMVTVEPLDSIQVHISGLGTAEVSFAGSQR